jgi:peptidoglycan/xylan/chitin deacetylase (PgdA/CDA1 family)
MRARRSPRWLTVLLYHRVLPRPDGGFELDHAVLDTDPVVFDRHMAFIASACSPIDLAQLLAYQRGEAELPHNPVMVTFDDGYLDNREHAMPILRRHGIRGLFFVASSFVAERRLFWWDRIAYLVRHSRVAVAELDYPTALILRVGDDAKQVKSAILRIVKTHRGLDLERFLGELARAFKVEWNDEIERRLADHNIMTWDDVRALHDSGMDVGSHTRTHRVLDTLDPLQLPDELFKSKTDIESAIGAKITSLSYPVGRPIRKLPMLERAVRDAGYEIGFSVETRAVALVKPGYDPYNVTRMPVDRSISCHRLAALLAAPELIGAM